MPESRFAQEIISPLPKPALTKDTAREKVLSIITVEESEALASIVVSALVVHFGTHESIPTWPDCLENHIARFLHLSQLPVDYVSAALTLIAEFSENNPHMYAENDDAEIIFITAMINVVKRMAEIQRWEYKYRRHCFHFQDRRWGTSSWKGLDKKMGRLFNNRKEKDFYRWTDYLDLETFLMDPKLDGWKQRKLPKLKTELRRVFFSDMVMRVFARGDAADEEDPKRWGTAGPIQLTPAHIQCRTGLCALDRGDLYPIEDDEPTGLPINMKYRPWGQNWDDGDFKHTKHGVLDKWTQVLNPEFDWERLYLNMYVMGPYQKAYILYSRDKRTYVPLNAEEKVLRKENRATKWARNLFFPSKKAIRSAA